MKHGTNCDCGVCKIGKTIGMIKKPSNTNLCSCGSGKKHEDCHGKEQ